MRDCVILNAPRENPCTALTRNDWEYLPAVGPLLQALPTSPARAVPLVRPAVVPHLTRQCFTPAFSVAFVLCWARSERQKYPGIQTDSTVLRSAFESYSTHARTHAPRQHHRAALCSTCNRKPQTFQAFLSGQPMCNS